MQVNAAQTVQCHMHRINLPSCQWIKLSTGHVHTENVQEESVPGSSHVEDINAFLFESESWSLPLPAEQTTPLKTD